MHKQLTFACCAWGGELPCDRASHQVAECKVLRNSSICGFAFRHAFRLKRLYLKSSLLPCRSPDAEVTADGGVPLQSGQEPGSDAAQGSAAAALDVALPGLPASQGQASGGLHGGGGSGGDKAGAGQQPRHQQHDTLPGRGVGKHASGIAPSLCRPRSASNRVVKLC